MSYFPVVAGPSAIGVQAVTASSAALALGFTPGARETSYAVTLGQTCAITIGNGAAGLDQVMTIDLIQGSGGGFVPSFANVSWAGGLAPAFNLATTKRDTVQVRGVGSDISGYPVSMGRLPMVSALPGAPSGITVTPGVAQNSIAGLAVVAYPTVTGYTIWRASSPGAEGAVAPIVMNTSLPYSDTGITSGTRYYYVVAAVNAVGTGVLSAEVSGVPLAAGSMPGAPASISVSAGDSSTVVSAAAVSASPAVTGYTVYRGLASGSESATSVATNINLPYTDAGLVNGTAYYYKVAAVNSVGMGPQSVEGSGTPVASAVHFATFTSGNQAIYASPSAAFNPGASPFEMRARVRLANWASGGSVETNLFGCWDGVTPSNRLWRLGLTTDGRIRASWATGASTFPTAVSSVVIASAGGTDLWLRAIVTPTTGAVSFYTSGDGGSWTVLGSAQTASGSGAVYVPGNAPYLVIGQNASGNSAVTQEQFVGRFIEAQFYIAGMLVTDPVMGSSSTVDSKGVSYATSSGVVYS